MKDQKDISEQRKEFAQELFRPLDLAIRKRFDPFERIAEVWDKGSTANRPTYKVIKGQFTDVEFNERLEVLGRTTEEVLVKVIDEDIATQLRASDMIANAYNVYPDKKVGLEVEGPVEISLVERYIIKKDESGNPL